METITVQDLKNKIDTKKEVFILDVRPKLVHESWKIRPYPNLQLINIPIQELNSQLDKLPKDKTIYPICNMGNSSSIATSQLTSLGYSAVNIIGGMNTWSTQFDNRAIIKGDISVYQFERLGKGCLSYMIIDGKDAVIIDPSIYIEQYIKKAQELNVTIKYIIDTHLHADHISGATELIKQKQAEYFCPKEDFKDASLSYTDLQTNKELTFGNNSIIKIVPTPGHTFGMTSLLLNNKFLFTGDTLFIKNVGRPDLSGNSQELAPIQFDTLKNLLNRFSEDTIILPTHFSTEEERNNEDHFGTSLKEIKEKNDLLNIQDKDAFKEKILSNLPPQPPNYSIIRQINLKTDKPTLDECKEIEFGPNNCAST